MKITKDYLRNLIKECMQDAGAPYPALPAQTAMIPAQEPAQSQSFVADPDGYEGRMAKGNLNRIAEYANLLQGLIQDGENLEPWVEEKIAVAASMMDSVGHYLKYEKMRNPTMGE